MSMEWTVTTAANDFAVGIGPLVAGVVVVALLIGAVVMGYRSRRRAPAPPRPEEQPKMPEGGPVREEQQVRRASEMPQDEEHRLTPHEMPGHGNASTSTNPEQKRPRWNEGGSGGFGSGGPGGT
ncbi:MULTISPECIES: DUF6479 family protein [Streptomyces]|jgi:hypothetical protein|nr:MULTISPECIES: DUF6479 family protein [Streptomyces]MDX3090353.1 DUF6479 family protein [Streptomyces sp. ME12-02E]MDX3333723.1 DUF6479 family protein [Streptomyces sp. ME02-6978a]MDX3358142.1 DUF6479 family protein [Streptomyces sp. ME02-6978.2a]WTI25462.1 DUF6479 family protein [Streptomyces jietaisiensis]SDE51494.1 hypothetical protein SAMN05216260_102210 [Streptomyces jietaisiensis]